MQITSVSEEAEGVTYMLIGYCDLNIMQLLVLTIDANFGFMNIYFKAYALLLRMHNKHIPHSLVYPEVVQMGPPNT